MFGQSIDRVMLAATLAAWLSAGALPVQTHGQEPEFEASQIEFFEKKIRPLLAEHCLECHGKSGEEVRGGLRLTSRAEMLQGGDSGPALVVGSSDRSLLISAVEYDEFEMPPKGKLSQREIDLLRRWVAMGAPDPRKPGATKPTQSVDLEAGRQFWSFRPIRLPVVPSTIDSSWPQTDIDRFILSKLEQVGIDPVETADRTTLLRRAYLTLIGLPPTIEQIDEFLADSSADDVAFARVVDELLASPHFGERWGRHWLDVVRFAESSGGGRSLMFENAWRFRDYVIEAYNEDRPFNEFVVEQLAGDLLPYRSHEQRARQLIATGMLVLGPNNYEQQDKEALVMDVIDEQIETIGRAFLGLTLGCARCHDHKFDPIPTRDYYGLTGILKSTQSLVDANVSRYFEQSIATDGELAAAKEHAGELARLGKRLAAMRKAESALREKVDEASAKQRLTQLRTEIKELRQQIKELKQQTPPRPMVMSVRDAERIVDSPIHIRGSVRNLGPIVERCFVSVCDPPDVRHSLPRDQSGRLELAHWIASPDHPLTARVYVNRIWRHLFGVGLVSTTDNFGTMGTRPSHPELLDYLAATFMSDGWSTKKLIRRIMRSRVYQLRLAHGQAGDAKDPRNRLYWRANRRRADVEVMRDSILAISGRLDRTAGGLTIRKITQYDLGYQFKTVRRSVYVPAFRNSMLEFFEAFDFANPNMVVGDRTTSTLPTQALFLMNHPFVIESAHAAAERLLAAEGELDDRQRIELVYRRTLGRLPTDDEASLSLEFVAANSGSGGRAGSVEGYAGLFHSLFASLDFRYFE